MWEHFHNIGYACLCVLLGLHQYISYRYKPFGGGEYFTNILTAYMKMSLPIYGYIL